MQRFFTDKLKPYMRLTPWERQRAIFVEYEREGKNQLEKDPVNDETLVTLSCWFANGLILAFVRFWVGGNGDVASPRLRNAGNGDLAPSGWVWLLVGGRKDGKPEIALPLADGVGRICPVGKIVVTE